MSKIKMKKYRLTYQVEAEKIEKVIELAFELEANTGMEPESLTLADGRILPWNGDAAHQFAAEGGISEKEFVEMSLKNNN